MAAALAIYSFLAVTRRLEGAGVMAAAILLNLAAAGVQESGVSFNMVFPFDSNGAFHLVQMVGLATLGLGLRMSMKPDTKQEITEPDASAVGSQ